MKQSTGELLEILKNADTIDDYLDKTTDERAETTLAAELSALLENCAMKPADLFRAAGIERSYGYDILAGEKHPSRDKVLALLFALNVSAEDAQGVLKRTGYPPLYARHERDSAILFALSRGVSLMDANEMLFDLGLEEMR